MSSRRGPPRLPGRPPPTAPRPWRACSARRCRPRTVSRTSARRSCRRPSGSPNRVDVRVNESTTFPVTERLGSVEGRSAGRKQATRTYGPNGAVVSGRCVHEDREAERLLAHAQPDHPRSQVVDGIATGALVRHRRIGRGDRPDRPTPQMLRVRINVARDDLRRCGPDQRADRRRGKRESGRHHELDSSNRVIRLLSRHCDRQRRPARRRDLELRRQCAKRRARQHQRSHAEQGNHHGAASPGRLPPQPF